MTTIEAAEIMTAKINEMNAFAKARVWVSNGVDYKVRVYLDKGYIEVKADNKANIETVGRNYFDAAKAALVAAGYARTYS